MSTTIGFGYSVKNDDFFVELKSIAEKFDYNLLKGIECAELDVQSGIEVAQKNEGWEQLVFLQAPKGGDASLAFGIEEELIAFETTGTHPIFFNFINEITSLATKKCKKFGIFFASEWYKNDRVRFSYGTVESLIALLSMPGHWGIRYMIPETGRLQDSDEIPLVFDLNVVTPNKS